MAVSFFDMMKKIFFGSNDQDSEPKEESLLHVAWEQRDESFYPALFGQAEGAPILLTEELFKNEFARNSIHPFWLHHGILTFSPNENRGTWLYATSGLSNAFDSEIDDYSGLGVEFILETKEKAQWAADKLARLMAFNLLIAAGHYRDQSDLTLGSIVRLDTPINGEDDCKLTNFIAHRPLGRARDFQLVTGKVELLQMVAITDEEDDFADKEGHGALEEKLSATDQIQFINPNRRSII